VVPRQQWGERIVQPRTGSTSCAPSAAAEPKIQGHIMQNKDMLTIAGNNIRSRLLVGSGKYRDLNRPAKRRSRPAPRSSRWRSGA
jgi:hypothetical protein